jgi:competence CoiA-like predicted nuclease
LYYHLKFKKQFIKWLWKSKQKEIIERYHPRYLDNLDENTNLDILLNDW